jgi:hypothetical protein
VSIFDAIPDGRKDRHGPEGIAMATATSRRAEPDTKILKERRALCEEKLEIRREIAPKVAREAAIDARLKVIATDTVNFKEVFADGSWVSASGAVAAEFKGEVPVIQTEVWRSLSPAERKERMKGGVIKIEEQWGKASSGRVTVKVFGETEAA